LIAYRRFRVKKCASLTMMMEESQNDHGAHANHNQQSCQHESHPKQHSLEWGELKPTNLHIAPSSGYGRNNLDTVTMITSSGDAQNHGRGWR
jgi:hypothetical protein